MPRFCTGCGMQAGDQHKFCARCGTRLGGSTGLDTDSFAAVTTSTGRLHGGTGKFGLEVKGESKYQYALRRARKYARRTPDGDVIRVFVRPEPDNPYDPNAIQVLSIYDDEVLGHLSRDRAKEYQRVLSQRADAGLLVQCEASVHGGTDDKPSIGIWLDLGFPSHLSSILRAYQEEA